MKVTRAVWSEQPCPLAVSAKILLLVLLIAVFVIFVYSFELTVEARESGKDPINSNVTVRVDVLVNTLALPDF